MLYLRWSVNDKVTLTAAGCPGGAARERRAGRSDPRGLRLLWAIGERRRGLRGREAGDTHLTTIEEGLKHLDGVEAKQTMLGREVPTLDEAADTGNCLVKLVTDPPRHPLKVSGRYIRNRDARAGRAGPLGRRHYRANL